MCVKIKINVSWCGGIKSYEMSINFIISSGFCVSFVTTVNDTMLFNDIMALGSAFASTGLVAAVGDC